MIERFAAAERSLNGVTDVFFDALLPDVFVQALRTDAGVQACVFVERLAGDNAAEVGLASHALCGTVGHPARAPVRF